MTRLLEKDVCDIPQMLAEYDRQLLKKTGKNLAGIAAFAAGRTEEELAAARENSFVAVIPVTCGEGIIGGFSESVRKIIEFMGFRSFVTEKTDVGGLAEAVGRGANIVFLSDDDNFVAINLTKRVSTDNGAATGRGYAAALELMAGGIDGKKVLLAGAGPVGTGAAEFLVSQGAKVSIYDICPDKSDRLTGKIPGITIINDFFSALAENSLILDATPAADIIQKQYIRKDTMVSAPGIPLGLCSDCLPDVSDRLVHDALEIGVATMLMDVLD